MNIITPDFMKEGAEKNKHGIFFYVFISFAILFVGNLLASFISSPFLMGYLMQNSEYVAMLNSDKLNIEVINSIVDEIIKNPPEWMTPVNLIANLGIIIAALFYGRKIEKRSFRSLGITGNFGSETFFGFVKGAQIFLLVFFVMFIAGVFKGGFNLNTNENVGISILYVIGFFIKVLAIEILTKGILLVALSRNKPIMFSTLISSVFYAFLVSDSQSLMPYITAFMWSYVTCLLFVLRENVWYGVSINFAYKILTGVVFGMNVQGKEIQGIFTMDLDISKNYQSLIAGGEYGMEASIILILALFIMIMRTEFDLTLNNKVKNQDGDTMGSVYEKYIDEMKRQNGNNPQNPENMDVFGNNQRLNNQQNVSSHTPVEFIRKVEEQENEEKNEKSMNVDASVYKEKAVKTDFDKNYFD